MCTNAMRNRQVSSLCKIQTSLLVYFAACLMLDTCDPLKLTQKSLCEAVHAYTSACMHSYASFHTYPRGSLIPDTCSNGTLGRKQLKDSCEIQNQMEIRLRMCSKITTLKKMEDFRFLIQCDCFKIKRKKLNIRA